MADDNVTDEALLFDPTLKKKKKKKVTLDLDAESPASPAPAAPEPAAEPAAAEDPDNLFADLKKKKKKKKAETETAAGAAADEEAQPEAGNEEKKKKKKKKDLAQFEDAAGEGEGEGDGEGAAEAAAEDGADGAEGKEEETIFEDGAEDPEQAAAAASGEGAADGDKKNVNIEELTNFAGMKKKKKAKPQFEDFEDDAGDISFSAGTETTAAAPEEVVDPWIGSNRDYLYNELLGRFFRILRQNNPELAGEKRRYTIAPPLVHKDGNKKTVFVNIVDICKRMHRQPEHVIQFLFAELGTSGSVDGSQRLIIKGRFQQKQIENVLRRYIAEYITCKTCKSPDTMLTKDNRLFFMRCESCGSSRSVSAIKTGFKAQTERRAVARRAATG